MRIMKLVDIIVYGPGDHHFDPAEHTDGATHMRLFPCNSKEYSASKITAAASLNVHVEAARTDRKGRKRGPDGSLVIELYVAQRSNIKNITEKE